MEGRFARRLYDLIEPIGLVDLLLFVLTPDGQARSNTASEELRHLWTSDGGEVRFVDDRYREDDAYMVAGPLADRRGLEGVLDTAASAGTCS